MGVEHGVGEILQGFQEAPGLIFPSWPDSPFFAVQAGEPSFSLIPTMVITGIFASLFSVAFIITVLFLPDKRYSRALMLGLSVLMFLTGSGIFPPILAILISLMAGRLSIPPSRWKSRVPNAVRPFFVRFWPWIFGLAVACWVMMFPVIPSLAFFFHFSNDILIYTVLAGMFLFLILANVSGKIRDIALTNANNR
jgi:hypothetical protein